MILIKMRNITPQILRVNKLIVFLILGAVLYSFNVHGATTLISNEFGSQPQALFYIFLMVFWVVFLLMTYNVKGVRGGTVGFFNILQLLFGLVVGGGLITFSLILGLGIIFVTIGTFVGMILYKQ